MRMTKEDKNRYLYEYAFYDVVRSYNEGQKATSNPDFIMASEGRMFRERLGQRLAANGQTLEALSIPAFQKAVNETLFERTGADVYDVSAGGKDKMWRGQFRDYMSVTGIAGGGTSELEEDGCYLPISPYDPRFAMNDAVLDNGSRLGGVPVAQVASAEALTERDTAMSAPYVSNLSPRGRDGAWRGNDRGVSLMNENDVLGMTRLKRFMSAEDFSKCSSWVARGFDVASMTPEQLRAHRRSMDKAVAILEELDREGRSYSIKPDMRPGQLQASVDNTRVSIRVMDTPTNARMIGRVYDNGVFMLLKTTASTNIADAPEPTIDETLMMVKYGLGEPFTKPGTDEPVGKFGTYTRIEHNKRKTAYATYHNQRGSHVAIGKPHRDPRTGRSGDRYNNQLYINVDASGRSASTSPMATQADADEYLREAVRTARENYSAELDVERIIRHVQEHGQDEDFAPELSGNPDVAIIQQGYYDVLTGHKSTLMRPGRQAEEFEERISEVGELETDGAANGAMYRSEIADLVYPDTMPPEEMVRAHAQASVDYQIGDYARDANGQRFNPVGVSAFQTSAYGIYRNNDDLVKAMRILDIKPEELKGDDFYTQTMKSKLVKFDFTSARPMMDEKSPFMQGMFQEIRSSLESNGVDFKDEDIRIDDNGIVHYTGQIATAALTTAKTPLQTVQGEIGQFFEPDEHGVVYTNFTGIENYAFVPGYEAHILAPTPGHPSTVEERTRLRGYEQAMRENIRYQIRQDFLSASRDGTYGAPTSVNDTYRHLYDERHDYDFVQQFREQGMEEDVLWAIVETEAARVRYPNAVRDGSTIHAEYTARTYGRDMANDNTGDAFVLTGGRNMAVLTEESDGYFDPIATTATSTNQGTLRYLVQGAQVAPDGRIIPSADKSARCAIMNHELARYMEFNPFDRQNMTISNLMQASAVTRPVHVAQMTFGGWTMDDPVVVSKKFAQEYKMRTRDGRLRDMVEGDKVTDPYGNKGVIAKVIDPDMPLDEAERQGIREQVEWFRANPDLDLVMAPFPAVSRFNGGTARELMENPQDLVSPDGTVLTGAMGSMRMIITDKAADTKTHVYDDDEVRMGHGRKASAQMAWALNAKGSPAIMRECFGNNSSALANIREQLITVGLDISETGEFRVGYQPHEGEVRRVIEMPELKYRGAGVTKDGRPSLDNKAMDKDFAELIAKSGGVMELPFELKYPTGEAIAPMNDGKTDVVYTKQEWERKGYTRKDGVYVRPTTVHRRQESGQRQTDNVTWGLPVMSSYLRSGQTFADGTSSVHDYTHQYIEVFNQANMYRACQEQLRKPGLEPQVQEMLQAQMAKCQTAAQASFDRITGSVIQRSFEGKHNVFRDEVMAHKMPNSATAVWTADPRLDIDQVAVGRAMADSIGLKDDDYTLIWRDPILRDGGMRYMRVKVDDSLTGVAINPVMDKSFEGDFDGDTVAVVNLQTPAAKREAFRNFSVDANLLDYGVKREGEPIGLSMQQSLDVKVAFATSEKDLKGRFEQMTRTINGFEEDFAAGNMSYKELCECRHDAVEALSDMYREGFSGQCGKAVIRYDSVEHHLESVKAACLDTGAKGSPAKLLDYMRWAGMEAPNAAEMDFTGATAREHTLATREDNEGVMYACAVKSFGTGIAGSYSQRGVSAMRNRCQKAVSELTAPVTQSLLQAKHDPAEARQKYEMLMGPARDLWRGAEVVRDENGHWQAVRDTDGAVVPAEKEAWKKSFKELYSAKDGLNVEFNPDYVDQVADALSDETGRIVNMESEDVDMAAPLDKLAYGGSFEMLTEMCRKGENLFEGECNSQFAPRSVRYNQHVLEERQAAVDGVTAQAGEPKAMHAFTKTDTLESGRDRKVGPKRPVAVGERRLPNNQVAAPSDGGHGEFGED